MNGGEGTEDEYENTRPPYPEELPETLGKSPEACEQELRFLVAAKLYELGRIASGRAAELAGLERAAFLNNLGRDRISVFNYPFDELDRESREARSRAEGVA